MHVRWKKFCISFLANAFFPLLFPNPDFRQDGREHVRGSDQHQRSQDPQPVPPEGPDRRELWRRPGHLGHGRHQHHQRQDTQLGEGTVQSLSEDLIQMEYTSQLTVLFFNTSNYWHSNEWNSRNLLFHTFSISLTWFRRAEIRRTLRFFVLREQCGGCYWYRNPDSGVKAAFCTDKMWLTKSDEREEIKICWERMD